MNRACIFLGAGVLVSAVLFAHPLAFQQSTESDRRFSVAVVRADGAMVPFAQFDAGLWRPIWDAPRGVIPLTLDDVEKGWWGRGGAALQWMLWQAPGQHAPLNVTSARAVAAPCGARPALGTDYTPAGPVPPADVTPYPKIGIASTAPIDFEPIEQLTEGDAAWERVEEAVDRDFDDAENQALEHMGWRHPTRYDDRKRAAIDLQSVWHVKGSRFFYFEAMRRYPDPKPPKGKPACDLVTYVAGYLWDSPSEKLEPDGVHALISYCHMEHAAFLWPFGVIREGGKQYWVLQSAGWTGERYFIVEPVAARGIRRHHVQYVAGQCR